MTENQNDLALIFKALEFASIKHRDQRRKDAEASPYINHPIALAKVLCVEGGVTDVNAICGAILHDTIEDTETTLEELTQNFGVCIAEIVDEVTDDKKLDKDVRKRLQIEHAPHASHQAKLVKLADKISNLRDILNSPPADWSLQRKQEYFGWAKQVVDQIKSANERLEIVFNKLYAQMPVKENK